MGHNDKLFSWAIVGKTGTEWSVTGPNYDWPPLPLPPKCDKCDLADEEEQCPQHSSEFDAFMDEKMAAIYAVEQEFALYFERILRVVPLVRASAPPSEAKQEHKRRWTCALAARFASLN